MYRRGSSRRHAIVRLGRRAQLRDLYKAYYSLKPPIQEPTDMPHREFAFQLWETSSYIRHLSFESLEALQSFLAEKAPRQAYYSIGRYQLPEAPSMEEKGWLGSPLFFDIDADHLGGCEGAPAPWDECLVKAARAADRLVSLIQRDLGVPRHAVTVSFTGNRGFHVTAECDWCMELNGRQRRLIAEYILGLGFDAGKLFPPRRRRAEPAAPSPEDPGWRGWLARSLGTRGSEPLSRVVALEDLAPMVSRLAVPIDMQVTQDPTRLERIPYTLNGKASLLAVRVGDPASFRPSPRLSPFRGEALVKAGSDLEGRLLGVDIRLRAGEEAPLPAYAAVALATLGLAELVGGEVVVRRDPGWRPL